MPYDDEPQNPQIGQSISAGPRAGEQKIFECGKMNVEGGLTRRQREHEVSLYVLA